MMKQLKTILGGALLAAALFVGGVQSASALSPFRFGVKAGMNINEMKFNEDAFSSKNRSGFTGGVMVQFVAPVINIGFDASLMYIGRRVSIPLPRTRLRAISRP